MDKLLNPFRYLLFFALLSIGLTHSSAAAQQEYGLIFVDEVTSIYDGDTFRVNINSWPDIIGHRVPIRVNGIDTPELRGKCSAEKKLAREAKQYTVSMLRAAKKIELRNVKRGKFFRVVADVSIDGADLGDSLIHNGLAVRYDGGLKVDWCLGSDMDP